MTRTTRAGTPWTRYQERQLLELRDDHALGWAEISAALGRSILSVAGHYRKLTERRGGIRAARKRAYRAGYDARCASQAYGVPQEMAPGLRVYWCGGWNDRDLEIARGMAWGGGHG